MVSIALVDARKTSLMGDQNSNIIGSPLRGIVDDAPLRRLGQTPIGEKLDPHLGSIGFYVSSQSIFKEVY